MRARRSRTAGFRPVGTVVAARTAGRIRRSPMTVAATLTLPLVLSCHRLAMDASVAVPNQSLGGRQPAPAGATPSSVADFRRPPRPLRTKHESPEKAEPHTPSAVPFGPDAPLVIGAVASDASWTYFCTPEEQDRSDATRRNGKHRTSRLRTPRFQGHLALADGSVQDIDALLGVSPSGRFTVTAREGVWTLSNMSSGETVDLGQLGIDRQLSAIDIDARSVAFDPTDSKLAILLGSAGTHQVLVLDLTSGQRTRIHPASQSVFRVGWDPAGKRVVLDELPNVPASNAQRQWPAPPRNLGDTRCTPPIAPYFTWPSRGHAVVKSLASPQGGDAELVPGYVTTLGSGWVRRTDDDRLAWVLDKTERPLGAPDCGAHVVAASRRYDELVVGCTSPGSRLALELWSSTRQQSLGFDIPWTKEFDTTGAASEYLAFYSGAKSWLVDLQNGRALELQDRDQVLAQSGTWLLVRRGDSLLRHDVQSQSEVKVADGIEPGARLLVDGAGAWIEPYLTTAAPESAVLRISGSVMAVTPSGCALLGTAKPEASGQARGPLTWRCAAPLQAKAKAL